MSKSPRKRRRNKPTAYAPTPKSSPLWGEDFCCLIRGRVWTSTRSRILRTRARPHASTSHPQGIRGRSRYVHASPHNSRDRPRNAPRTLSARPRLSTQDPCASTPAHNRLVHVAIRHAARSRLATRVTWESIQQRGGPQVAKCVMVVQQWGMWMSTRLLTCAPTMNA